MPIIRRTKVVFPEPFGPISPTISFLSMLRLTFLTAIRPPKDFVKFSISRKDPILSFSLLPQLSSRYFSDIRPRNLSSKLYNLWDFVMSQFFLAVTDNFLFRHLPPCIRL